MTAGLVTAIWLVAGDRLLNPAFVAAMESTVGGASQVSVTITLLVILAVCALLYLHFRHFDIRSLYPRPQWMGALEGVGIYAVAVVLGGLVTESFEGNDSSMPVVAFSFQGVSLASTVAFATKHGPCTSVGRPRESACR